jgi:hypothetical protein
MTSIPSRNPRCPGARVSPRTRKSLPTIEPIVPVTGTPLLHDPQWIYEPKAASLQLLPNTLHPLTFNQP